MTGSIFPHRREKPNSRKRKTGNGFLNTCNLLLSTPYVPKFTISSSSSILCPHKGKTEDYALPIQTLKMKKCELCSTPAKLFCESDQACLCWECDARVHGANFLVTKHSRTLLCHVCQSLTPWHGSGPRFVPTISVCNHCIASKNENHDDDHDEDDDDDDEDEDDDDDVGAGNDEDDEENQVVPWAIVPPPPPASSSSNSSSSF